jgi:hypothetical protein
MVLGKIHPPPADPQERVEGPTFQMMMKAVHQTFDIRCSAIRAAASRLAVLPAELRLIGP